jgi:hypothetical protein
MLDVMREIAEEAGTLLLERFGTRSSARDAGTSSPGPIANPRP